ncbi:hypothetical protein [Noviherbaspirillum galbum]|uniref:Uncharacterized protein n=1 Tax=Noviherbaspirillum galbum TaxID=2709383 RepID=A0A6B3SRZ5_9BURK|nr:hypothetical protein [Noviherbaspirillum galbum]NEX63421.1 hypothetical protein [Noviherbaspirillum galbum]
MRTFSSFGLSHIDIPANLKMVMDAIHPQDVRNEGLIERLVAPRTAKNDAAWDPCTRVVCPPLPQSFLQRYLDQALTRRMSTLAKAPRRVYCMDAQKGEENEHISASRPDRRA